MTANKFKITGSPKSVSSYADFLALEKEKIYKGILFYADNFNENILVVLKQKDITYLNISFKDTTFVNVSFVNCTFNGCLLLSSKFIKCEFINCKFINTNTKKSEFTETLIDPEYFRKNFDLKTDTNIAIDLYQALYKGLSNERQPERSRQSLYLMHRAQNAHLNSQLKRNRIGLPKFIQKKTGHLFRVMTSGYGLKLHRITFTLIAFVSIFSVINYYYRDDFFGHGVICSPLDSIYFTVVTLTTLGYGDIVPQTGFGKIVVAGEVMLGIVIIFLFLSSISSRVVRS